MLYFTIHNIILGSIKIKTYYQFENISRYIFKAKESIYEDREKFAKEGGRLT